MKKQVLITGAAGFIGSNISSALTKLDWQVVGIDNLRSGRLSNIEGIDKNFIFYNFDINNYKIEQIFLNHKIEQIIHLAAIPRVSYSVENPVETNETNTTGTLKILDIASKFRVKRVIFASSSSVYGGSKILPTPEDTILNPKSPYALQKKIGEEYCKLYSELYNIDTVSMRFFNIFGPKQYGDSPYASVISAFCQSIKNGQVAKVYGDGTFFRDFTYIDNVVNFIIKTLEYENKLNGETFNVGCGERTSINDLLKIMNISKVEYLPERLGDVPQSHADISKSKYILNYTPSVNINVGLKNTLEWYLNF